jgi:hypothetical protein
MRLAAQLAEPDFGWAYVVAGFTITGAVIAGYYARIVVRTRRAERSLPPEADR